MRFFVDSADIDEIREAFSLPGGMVTGVTTNPTLIQKARATHQGVSIVNYIVGILHAAFPYPVSLEVDGRDEADKITTAQMVDETIYLYDTFSPYNPALNIKIPACPALSPQDNNHEDGLEATKILKEYGIQTNFTLMMALMQAIMGEEAGATYGSPFLGRLDDRYGLGRGIEFAREVMYMAKTRGWQMQVIGASIRNLEHIMALARYGAHIATVPLSVLRTINLSALPPEEPFTIDPVLEERIKQSGRAIDHELTYAGVQRFLQDADKVPEYLRMLKEGAREVRERRVG